MKTKQLAYVLIKIVGLSVIVQSIPNIFTMLMTIYTEGFAMGLLLSNSRGMTGLRGYVLSSGVLAVVGICLIIFSRTLADMLFREEVE